LQLLDAAIMAEPGTEPQPCLAGFIPSSMEPGETYRKRAVGVTVTNVGEHA
jgi:hypothetical protein